VKKKLLIGCGGGFFACVLISIIIGLSQDTPSNTDITSTPRPTITQKSVDPTLTTYTPWPTPTPSLTPTLTHTPKPTHTPEPTHAPTETPTITPSRTPRPTYTPRPTNTPVPCPYIGNSNSKKFHHHWCNSVDDMKDSHKVCFQTREEAVAAGYEPCGNCKP